MSDHETNMEIRRLRARLFAAENVAALYGWTAVTANESVRDKALHELWRQWAAFPGVSTSPDDYPWLSDEALEFYAGKRDQTRAETLRRLVGEGRDR